MFFCKIGVDFNMFQLTSRALAHTLFKMDVSCAFSHNMVSSLGTRPNNCIFIMCCEFCYIKHIKGTPKTVWFYTKSYRTPRGIFHTTLNKLLETYIVKTY